MKMFENFRKAPGHQPAKLPRPTIFPGRQLTNHAPKPGQASVDEYSKFDEYLVPEKIEHREYRFENNYGAAVNYYRGTNTYDLDAIKWIGEQHIFIDEPHIGITHQAEDIVTVLNEIKNKRGY